MMSFPFTCTTDHIIALFLCLFYILNLGQLLTLRRLSKLNRFLPLLRRLLYLKSFGYTKNRALFTKRSMATNRLGSYAHFIVVWMKQRDSPSSFQRKAPKNFLLTITTTMPKNPKMPAHKLGPNRKETARKQRRLDPNFAQSRDIREDRGERQIKTSPHRRSLL